MMKRLVGLLAAAGVLAVPVSADVSGRVVDEGGSPVAGAEVVLRTAGASAVSAGDGTFVLPYSSAAPAAARSVGGGWVRLVGAHVLQVGVTSGATRVRVEAFSVAGRAEAVVCDRLMDAGTHLVSLAGLSGSAEGAHLLRVSMGGGSQVVIANSLAAVGSRPHAADAVPVAAVRAQNAVVDTVRVMAAGYAPARMQIGTLDTAVGDIALHDIDPRMVLIAAADSGFMMGQPRASIGGYNTSSEQPVHHVAFTYSYYLDSTEVTQADYEAVMGEDGPWDLASNTFKAAGIGDSLPAHSVTWYNAILYCNARSKRDGLDTVYVHDEPTEIGAINNYRMNTVEEHFERNGYRLPTEAEWEYAYTMGDTFDYYWGVDWTDGYPVDAADSAQVDSFAVYNGNSYSLGSGDPLYGTHPVAGKAANGNRLYDMSGNVAEWVGDWYAAYAADSLTDPTGPTSGSARVVRGGGWESEIRHHRAHRRLNFSPQSYDREYGFRVALPLR